MFNSESPDTREGEGMSLNVEVLERSFGVVAPKEWDAVRAAKKLEVKWNEKNVGFPTTSDELFDWIRAATPGKSEIDDDIGDVDAAIAGSAKTITAEFEWPFQSHARMAGAASERPYEPGPGFQILRTSYFLPSRRLLPIGVSSSFFAPLPVSYGFCESVQTMAQWTP